ncbi:MAG: HlyD family efflux transporter periplasmic adaptor subunit [Thiotrichales bacterium]|nr:HlyD family efflux transporter periplasmic adaptor subunit [Thiotrichales bacterium]
MTILSRLCDTYGHAIGALTGGQLRQSRFTPGMVTMVFLAILLLVMLLPVRLSALAPVVVVAKDPVIVSAPINGVIKEIHANPNTYVKAGNKLLTFDDTNLRNKFEVAEKTLAVCIAEYRKASQSAFGDSESKARLALLKTRVELSQAEVDFAQELLDQVDITAPLDGLLLYTDKDDWVGRPVSIGERIMEIANPDNIELRINLAVDDAIILEDNAEAEIFLDVDPLNSMPATVTYKSYLAELTPDNLLAFRLTAGLNDPEQRLRIGLQGTAKIYSKDVSLFFYLFRRPISSLRQMIGL